MDLTSGTVDKSISMVADVSGTWYASVSGYDGAFDIVDSYHINAQSSDCLPDAREDNNDAAHAYSLDVLYGGYSEAELSICPAGDQDWFSTFFSSAGDRFSGQVIRTSGSAIPQLCLIAGDGQTELACTRGVSDNEQVSFTITQRGKHYIRVEAASEQNPTNRRYIMSLSALRPTPTTTPTPTPTPTATARWPSCPDTHENNDGPLQAKVLAGSVQSYLCADGDRDWWRFQVTRGQAQQKIIQLELDHPSQQHNIVLYRPDGRTPVDSGIKVGQSNTVIVSFVADQDGVWYAEVKPSIREPNDPSEPYTLWRLSPDCHDSYESNDTFASAKSMGQGDPLDVRSYLCRAWDKDYFTFHANVGQRISIGLSGYASDYTITLYDPWQSRMDVSGLQIEQDATVSGDYFVLVQSKSGWRSSTLLSYGLTVVLGPRPSLPERDLELMDVEVIQTIQNLTNDTRLVTGKETWARMYVSGGQHEIKDVVGYLSATLDGTPLDPPQRFCPWKGTAYPVPSTSTGMRGGWSKSINCPLPVHWLWKKGTLAITGHVYSTQIDDPTVTNNVETVSLQVEEAPSLTLQLVQVRDGCDPGQCTESDGPSRSDYANIYHLIRAMYPVARVQIIWPSGPGVRWVGEQDTLVEIARQAVSGTNTFVMGVVRDSVLWWKRGLARVGRNGSWVEVGASEKFQGLAAHELAHNLGANHVDGCGTTEPRDGYTTFRGSPRMDDGNVRNYYGLNTLTSPPTVMSSWGTADIMTYCDHKWPSEFHFNMIRASLRRGASLPLNALALSADSDYLLISGNMDPQPGQVDRLAVFRISGGQLNVSTETNPHGRYAARLLDSAGFILEERSFGFGAQSHPEAAGTIRLFLPYHPDMARLVIVHEGDELFSRSVSGHAPSVSLDPISGAVPDSLTLSWSGNDDDGDSLAYMLQFSTDDGLSWELLGMGLEGSQTQFSTRFWPETEEALLRIQVSDGLNTAEDTTGPFTVSPPTMPRTAT